MGIPESVSCKCLKTCRDYNEEVDLAKGDYLRSRTGNFKINNDPKNLAPFQQANNIEINTIGVKKEVITTENNNSNEIIEKESLQKIDEEDEEDNKQMKTDNIIKTTNTNNDQNKDGNLKNENDENNNNINANNNVSSSISKKNSSSMKFLKDADYTIFFTETLKKAEKNFNVPINYEKDWSQYCDETDNEDMLILINSMNKNKGENHTKEEGQVIEYKGEKYLYIGELDKNQKLTGFGVLYTTQGEKYEGNFINGKLIGLGRYIDEEGTCYEGIFKNNKLVSKAKIIKCNDKNKKIQYFGEVLDFKKNGKGEEICDEYKYKGDFLEDVKHGYGRLFLQNGDLYDGEFKKGEITGKGLYIWSNKQQYKGDFVNGIKHGKGKYKWPDGYEYDGEYNNGVREGFGEYKWSDGRVFKGRFKDNKPDGKGKMTYNGKTVNVEYKDGKPTVNIKKLFREDVKND